VVGLERSRLRIRGGASGPLNRALGDHSDVREACARALAGVAGQRHDTGLGAAVDETSGRTCNRRDNRLGEQAGQRGL
jgi:hypothetical protein